MHVRQIALQCFVKGTNNNLKIFIPSFFRVNYKNSYKISYVTFLTSFLILHSSKIFYLLYLYQLFIIYFDTPYTG